SAAFCDLSTPLLLGLLAAGLMAPPQARERQNHTTGSVRWIAGALLAALMMVMVFAQDASATAPNFQAGGLAVQGTTSASPAWPTGGTYAIDDIALLFVETAGGQPATLSVPAGFAPVLNSPQATGAGTVGTQITVFWARATSTSMSTPTVAVASGDQVYARILTYRGVVGTGNPWDVTGGGVTSVTTSPTLKDVTTTVPDPLIVQGVAVDENS